MYFLDTYAMIEYVKGRRVAVELINNNKFCTSDFQLMELYYCVLREDSEQSAETYYGAFSAHKISIPEQILKNAMKTRLEFQKKGKNISYVDAIGYQYAIENEMKFVTGDLCFRNFDERYVFYLGK